MSQISSVILAVPLVAMLALFVFRVDSLFFRAPARQAVASQRPRFANFEPSSTLMTDPDGRVTGVARAPRRQLLRDTIAPTSRSTRPL